MLWKKLTKEKSKESKESQSSDTGPKVQKEKGGHHGNGNGRLDRERDRTRKESFVVAKMDINRIDEVFQDTSLASKGGQERMEEVLLQLRPDVKEVKQSKLVPQSSQSQYYSKSGHHSEEIESQIKNAYEYKTCNFIDASSKRNQSSQGNSEQQLELPHPPIGESHKTYFKSISLGKARPKPSHPQPQKVIAQSQSPHPTLNKWKEEDEPVIMYSSASFNEDSKQLGLKRLALEDGILETEEEGIGMEDFFKQMEEAGIDVCDLQSMGKSRDISVQSQDRVEVEEREITTEKKIYEKTGTQPQNHKPQPEQQKQLKKTKIKNPESISNRNANAPITLYTRIQKELLKLRQLKKEISLIISETMGDRQWMDNFTEGCLDRLNAILKQEREWDREKERERERGLRNQYGRVVEELKYKIFSMEAEILEKEVTIQRQREINEELKAKNDELQESIFDMRQELAQGELVYQQKLHQFMETYPMKFKADQHSLANQQELLQIQRLSEEVEELTRLYENSQNQHKAASQNQKIALALQTQKLARKQTQLYQKENTLLDKQQSLQQTQKHLQQESQKISTEQQKLIKKQQELRIVERTLQEKLQKVEELEVELNQGFAYIDEVRKESEENMERVQVEKEELMGEIQRLRRKLSGGEKGYRGESERDYGQVRQKSLVSSLENEQKINEVRQKILKSTRHQIEKNSPIRDRETDRNSFKDPQPVLQTERISFNPTGRSNEEPRMIFQKGVDSRDRKEHFYSSDFGAVTQRSRSGSGEKYPFNSGWPVWDRPRPSNREQNFGNQRKNPKFMSQVISPSSSFNPLPKLLFVPESPASPPYRPQPLLKRSPPKKQAFKLNQLDSKIEALRSEIKREIKSAKNRQ